MAKLRVQRREYDAEVLDAWIKRRRNAISFPSTSAGIAKQLRRKVRGRSVRSPRFFGEAFVLSKNPHRDALYSSCKWLTNPRFVEDRKLPDPELERLRAALHNHFGAKQIKKLQRVVRALAHDQRRALHNKLPTAPDLWIIDKRGQHWFIEVKLPGDSLAPHQLAGMAAIASVLRGPRHVTVEVVQLNDDDRMFRRFWRSAKEVARRRAKRQPLDPTRGRTVR